MERRRRARTESIDGSTQMIGTTMLISRKSVPTMNQRLLNERVSFLRRLAKSNAIGKPTMRQAAVTIVYMRPPISRKTIAKVDEMAMRVPPPPMFIIVATKTTLPASGSSVMTLYKVLKNSVYEKTMRPQPSLPVRRGPCSVNLDWM